MEGKRQAEGLPTRRRIYREPELKSGKITIEVDNRGTNSKNGYLLACAK